MFIYITSSRINYLQPGLKHVHFVDKQEKKIKYGILV
jgi:hypothetical protein